MRSGNRVLSKAPKSKSEPNRNVFWFEPYLLTCATSLLGKHASEQGNTRLSYGENDWWLKIMKTSHQFPSTIWEIWLFKISFFTVQYYFFVAVFVILCCLYNQLMLIFENFLCNLSITQVCFSKVKQQNILIILKNFGPCLFYAAFIRLVLMVICI